MCNPSARKLIFLLILIIGSHSMFAQAVDGPPIVITARSYEDRIVLRYFATTPQLFKVANQSGYIIEKAMAVSNQSKEQLTYTPIKNSPYKRWNEDQWTAGFKQKTIADSNETNLAGLAMGLTEGNAFMATGDMLSDNLKSLNEIRNKVGNNFSFTIMASLQSKLAAEGLGLWAEDKEVQVGKNYWYRIRVNQTSVNKNDWVYIAVQCKPFSQLYLKNDTLVKVVPGDQTIQFSFPESLDYFAYFIYRKDAATKPYKKLTPTPSIQLTPIDFEGTGRYGYVDSGLINYQRYQYKITVITPFADELVLGEFTAMPKDLTPPPAPNLTTAKHMAPKEIMLQWNMLAKLPTDFKGFNIGRSNNDNDGFKKINTQLLPANVNTFKDTKFTTDQSLYYIVEAVDTAGNSSYSFPLMVALVDSTPPAAPVIQSAIIDSVGKITIRFKPNTEKDFLGYQLMKANAADHDFSIVYQSFNDSTDEKVFVLYDSTTLNTLTKKIYYKAIAFDSHFNQSVDSKIIEVKRPDTIPPIAPMIVDYRISDTAIQLTYVPSESEDVVTQYLFRKEISANKVDTLMVSPDLTKSSFSDNSFNSGKQYEYTMIAKDDAGLFSKLSPPIVIMSPKQTRLPKPVVTATYSKDKNEISLSFSVNTFLDENNTSVIIYAKNNLEASWNKLEIVPYKKNTSHIVKPQSDNKELFFSIVLVDKQGRSSVFSEPLKLVL
jgi:hypothetical protein